MNHKKMNQPGLKSRRHRYIAIGLAGCISAAVLCWGLLRFSPRAYHPLTAANPDEVSPYLTHRLGPEFFNQVQFYEPFDLTIEQYGFNDIISRGGWPRQFGPMHVGTPAALFEHETLYLMSRVSYHGFSSVLTVKARPTVDAQGRLNLNIQTVRLGLLPVTATVIRIAEKTLDDNAGRLRDWPGAEANLRAILANQPFDPSFYFDKQKIGVQRITLEPGMLRVRLAPENKAVYRY